MANPAFSTATNGQAPEFAQATGHEATARPMCATCFRAFQPRNVTVCRTPRPCIVKRCENLASVWVIDAE